MTPLDSKIRLVLYVLIAMITTASAGLATIDFENSKEVIGYALGIIATGLVTARSYIDKTPSDVKGGDQ